MFFLCDFAFSALIARLSWQASRILAHHDAITFSFIRPVPQVFIPC